MRNVREPSALRQRAAAVALMLLLVSGCATSGGTAPYVPDTEPRSVEYPPEAKRLGLEGTVDLRVMLGEDGAVKDITFVHAAGHGFDEAAADYVRRTKYAPARMLDGRAVPAEFRVRSNLAPAGWSPGAREAAARRGTEGEEG